jgi:hypothetical protein
LARQGEIPGSLVVAAARGKHGKVPLRDQLTVDIEAPVHGLDRRKGVIEVDERLAVRRVRHQGCILMENILPGLFSMMAACFSDFSSSTAKARGLVSATPPGWMKAGSNVSACEENRSERRKARPWLPQRPRLT